MKLAIAGALCAFAASIAPAAATPLSGLDLMRVFNNIVLGNLQTNVETEGTLFVGGNYTGNGATVNPRNLPDVDLGGGVSGAFVVGGALSAANVNLNNGSAHIGGSVSTNFNNNGGGDIAIGGAFAGALNLNGGAATIAGARSGNINLNGGSVTQAPVAPVPVAEVAATLLALSSELSMLDATGGIASLSDNNNVSFQSVAGPDGIAVFNLDFDTNASIFGVAGTFNGVNAAPGVTTIVNVAGKNVSWRLNANQTFPSVLFNFFEAEELSIQASFNVSILAPKAAVRLSGGGINGTLVSGNLFQDAEVRPLTFQGDLPPVSQVPLPASAFLLLGGLGFLGGLRARRRAA